MLGQQETEEQPGWAGADNNDLVSFVRSVAMLETSSWALRTFLKLRAIVSCFTRCSSCDGLEFWSLLVMQESLHIEIYLAIFM